MRYNWNNYIILSEWNALKSEKGGISTNTTISKTAWHTILELGELHLGVWNRIFFQVGYPVDTPTDESNLKEQHKTKLSSLKAKLETLLFSQYFFTPTNLDGQFLVQSLHVCVCMHVWIYDTDQCDRYFNSIGSFVVVMTGL